MSSDVSKWNYNLGGTTSILPSQTTMVKHHPGALLAMGMRGW